MGLFDAVKSLAKKAKCATGFHGGDFKPIQGKPECHVAKTCPDCNQYVIGYRHKFGDWNYMTSYNCRQDRECFICGIHEGREEHQYGVTGIDDRCNELLECGRCHDKKRGHERHSWGDWSKRGDMAVKVCAKCGKSESKKLGS